MTENEHDTEVEEIQPAEDKNNSKWMRDLVRDLLILVVFVFAFRAVVAEANWIPTSSMVPILAEDDKIIVDKISLNWREIERGDIVTFFPPDAPAWDNTSNNKWLISGRGALILNPPSAWAVAKRDAPQVAEQLWTHGMPSGPKGRFAPCLPFFWGVWNFSKNKEAAKSLLVHLSQPAAIEQLVAASGGFDLPPFTKFATLRTWAEEGPPKGTLYHYPNPHNHQILSIAGAPAPPQIAAQIFTQGIMTKMTVRHLRGEAMETTLAWAETEVGGFMRT